MRMPDVARTLAMIAALLAAGFTAFAQKGPDAPPVLAAITAVGAVPTGASAAPPSGASPAPAASETSTAASAAPESLLIGPGDLLRITVLREPELNQTVRVLDSGEISLELAGNVPVQELTPAEAAARIAAQYLDGKFLLHPEVSVLVVEYATETVTVLGQVAHPGTVRLTTPRTLIDVLSLAGGFNQFADRHVVVERKTSDSQPAERIHAYLPNRADDDLNADILVRPGDTVIVPKAGIVYVLGDVAHPGGYVMQNDSKLTVLEAIALASGTEKTASERKARLVRTIDGRPLSVELPLRDMERGREPDVSLRPNDIVYVPFSVIRNFSLGLASIAAAASSALIYATQ
ncbi:MAG: polysaccharide biosynthesis/export family protein [Acidobacteriaceae bacterium]